MKADRDLSSFADLLPVRKGGRRNGRIRFLDANAVVGPEGKVESAGSINHASCSRTSEWHVYGHCPISPEEVPLVTTEDMNDHTEEK